MRRLVGSLAVVAFAGRVGAEAAVRPAECVPMVKFLDSFNALAMAIPAPANRDLKWLLIAADLALAPQPKELTSAVRDVVATRRFGQMGMKFTDGFLAISAWASANCGYDDGTHHVKKPTPTTKPKKPAKHS